MKERTSQSLDIPLFIGAFIGFVSGIPLLIDLINNGAGELYEWTSCASTLLNAVVFLVLGILIKRDKIYGDWDVLTIFLFWYAIILIFTGALAIYSHDPKDVIAATAITTGIVDIIVAVIVLGMLMVMKFRKIRAMARAVYYLLIIGIALVVIVAIYNLVNTAMNTSDFGTIMSAFGGMINKILIAVVLFAILKRDEVKNRLFYE